MPHHRLPPSSAKRIADSIRRELGAHNEDRTLYRLVTYVSPSMWKLITPDAIIGASGQVKLSLTSVPDYPALFSLMWRICRRRPSHNAKRLTRRERWFLTQLAQEAQEQGVWLCEKHPLTAVFHCAPSLHCVSTSYPSAFVDFVLERLDACA